MDGPESKSKSFRFGDPRQGRIYRCLLLLGPGPAAFYRDACRLMYEDYPLDTKTHLVAHCLREIEGALRQVLVPYNATSTKDCNDSHRKQIESILAAYNVEERVGELWLRLAGKGEDGGLHRLTHRKALAAPRRGDESFRKFWGDTEILLDLVLAKFETRFLDSLHILDELLATKSPTISNAKLIHNKVPNNAVTLRYFFDRLSNPAWLEPLRREGFFSHPPEPVLDDEGGTVGFRPWPESRYLVKMAALPDHQQKVLEIALDIPDTPNFYIDEDLVDIALALPAKLAARLLSERERWLGVSRHPLLPEKLGSLVSYLAKGGEIEAALNLARSLLAVVPGQSLRKEAVQSADDEEAHATGEASSSRQGRPETPKEKTLLERMSDLRPDPQAHFDLWHYEQIIKKNVPELVSAAGMGAFTLLCNLLETAVTLSRSEQAEGPEDYSYIWRPQIEGVHERHLHGVEDVLVSAVRDAAEQIGKANSHRLPELINELNRRPWHIFHRIGLHILRIFADEAPELVAVALIDRRKFDELGQRHEYKLLVQAQFGCLSKPDQVKFLGWIEQGPDVQPFKELVREQAGEGPTDEQTETYIIRWRLEHLKSIRDVLPPEWKERYQGWIAKVGEPEDIDAYPRSWVGPTSPKSEQELRSMSVTELIDYLKTWQPSEEIMTPSPEGLGRILAAIIASDPGRFTSEARRFQEVDPTYVQAFFRGLHDVAKAKRVFSWQPALDLCRWVVGQPREIPGRKSEYGDLDRGRGWTRKTIGELLSAGFEDSATEIPYQLRSVVWDILEPLTQDPEPTPEYEAAYGGSNMDPDHVSINTTRGEAMHAVVSYALWVRRHLEKLPDAPERLGRGFEEIPEVRKVLDEHLDVSRDPSLAIRSVYGRWFPWLVLLDRNWVESRLGKIFPEEASQGAYRDTAWQTYIVFCRPYDSVFDLLRGQYALAIERLGTPRGDRRLLADPDEQLAQHLMEFYWRKKIDLRDPLLERFWEKASDQVRAHAMEYVGRSLKNTQGEIPPEILRRFQDLWEYRVSNTQNVAKADGHQAEIAAFGWWFVSGKFEDNWAMAQLLQALRLAGKVDPDHWVIERLAVLVSTMPPQAVDCLRLIIEGDSQRWTTYGSREEIREIISAALKSGDPEAATRARDLV